MRQDPDVVFVGEMRDSRTVTAGMRASETGHMVMGTMHSANASQAVHRLLDLFPTNERELVRQALAISIRAIISQVLLPSIREEVDRIPAVEVLLAHPGVRKLISEGREGDLPSVIRASQREGMLDLTDNLCRLVQEGWIDPKDAYKYAPNSGGAENGPQGDSHDRRRDSVIGLEYWNTGILEYWKTGHWATQWQTARTAPTLPRIPIIPVFHSPFYFGAKCMTGSLLMAVDYGGYISIVKLVLFLACIFLWLLLLGWAHKDAKAVATSVPLWIGVLLGAGAMGILLWWLIPIFFAGCWPTPSPSAATALAYVRHRNGRVLDFDRS
jgi:hypothetical protein